jgi:hypothetical protein
LGHSFCLTDRRSSTSTSATTTIPREGEVDQIPCAPAARKRLAIVEQLNLNPVRRRFVYEVAEARCVIRTALNACTNALFLNFSYVCPELVLVKWSFCIRKWTQRHCFRRFRTWHWDQRDIAGMCRDEKPFHRPALPQASHSVRSVALSTIA